MSANSYLTPLRILALGDSYTVGESVPHEECCPVQLAQALSKSGRPTATPTIIAQTGWTSSELLCAIEQANPGTDFDLVTLQVGVNNQYRGQDIAGYRKEFRALLERAIGCAGARPGRVVVLSIPDWSATPFAHGQNINLISWEIDMFNQVNQLESKRALVRYVDVTQVSRLAIADRNLVASDGLHPSGKMYAMWVALLLTKTSDFLGIS